MQNSGGAKVCKHGGDRFNCPEPSAWIEIGMTPPLTYIKIFLGVDILCLNLQIQLSN